MPSIKRKVITESPDMMEPRMEYYQKPARNYTPFLMVLLIIASFLLGMLFTKVQYLEKGVQPTTPPTTGQQAAAPTQAAGPVKVDVGRFPAQGNKDAKVKIIEFADFQCPFCERFYKDTEKAILDKYGDQVAFYFRNWPFLGQESTDAANAAECANEQGKFWEYHNYLYDHQGQENSGTFTKDNLKSFAASLGLNADQFNSCVDSDKYAKEVAADLKAGQDAGVNGTPGTFINGQLVVGAQPFSAFQTLIDQELKK